MRRKWKCNEIPSEDVLMDRESFHFEQAESAEKLALDRVVAEDLKEALKQLPEGKRQVLILRIYHGLTHQEIAQHMGLKENYVRTLYHRGVQLIRTFLQEKWGE